MELFCIEELKISIQYFIGELVNKARILWILSKKYENTMVINKLQYSICSISVHSMEWLYKK